MPVKGGRGLAAEHILLAQLAVGQAGSYAERQTTMATADQIKALIRSHLEGDDERFRAVAIQVAAHAARQGKGQVATEIKALVDEAHAKARARSAPRPIPIATPKGELAGLLSVSYPETRLADMVARR